MRHSIWSKRMYEECGAVTAYAIGTAHEIDGLLRGQPLDEARMDLHNNAEGRDAARENRPINSSNLVTSPNSNRIPY
jgi:hypothetical protein